MTLIPERQLSLHARRPTRRASAHRLRLRLLIAIGAISLGASACSETGGKDAQQTDTDGGDSNDAGECPPGNFYCDMFGRCCPSSRSTTVQASTSVPRGQSCPNTLPPSELEYTRPLGYAHCYNADLAEQVGDQCTYDIPCSSGSSMCCTGRPYRRRTGVAVTAPPRRGSRWLRRLRPTLGSLDSTERANVADGWLDIALQEHASIAGFHRHALDLLRHGAPPELVRRANQAAMDEIGHAIDAFSLAAAYSGTPREPSELPLGEEAPVAASLAELAVWTFIEGALGETISAWQARHALDRASDPVVRQVLQRVVDEELAHAELAWETLRWTLEQGGEEVLVALREASAGLEITPHTTGFDTEASRAHGLLGAAGLNAAAQECLDEVIRPVLVSLLALDLAA